MIRKEVSEPVYEMAHDAPEHIVEALLPGIDITRLAGLEKAVEQFGSLTTSFAASKQIILPP